MSGSTAAQQGELQSPTMNGGTLTVDFLGEVHTLHPTESATFGRAADIVIDTNPALHRVVGQFFSAEGSWWLTNLGRAAALDVVDRDSASSLRIAPGATARLSFPRATVSFGAGAASYSLEVQLDAVAPELPTTAPIDGDETVQPSTLPFTPEQTLLVVTLAEPWLRSGVPADLPTNREVASKLGWSMTKFNRKLDAVCRKLADGGVTGLVGSSDRLARDRRQRLVEHSIYAGLISSDDLAVLDSHLDGSKATSADY